ncbi:hypothetical protein Tco_1163591 [Tanacetum coccineum]
MVAYLKKPEGSEGFHQIVDFLNASHIRYALTENPTIYVSLIKQFWETATAKTLDNGEIELTATIDGKVKIVTEASVRRHLQLADSDGISSLPTTEIFEQLSLMGPKKTSWEQFSSNIATAIICLATNRKFNFSKLIFDGMGLAVRVKDRQLPLCNKHNTHQSAPSTSQPPISPPFRRTTRQKFVVPQPRSPTQIHVADEATSTGVDVRYGGAATTVTGLEAGQDSGNFGKTPTMPHDLPFPRINTLGIDEDSMKLEELMVFCTNLSKKVESLETDLKQTKQVYGAAYTKLIMKVKKLEKTVKSSHARRRARIVFSDDEVDEEDSSKQGRKIDKIDQDPDISLVQHDLVSTAGAAVTTASISIARIASATKFSTDDDVTLADTLVYIRRSAAKDKGKGKMDESEPVQTKIKLQQEQERLGYEAAVRLQAKLVEEDRQRITSVHESASSFNIEEWEDIQARIQADEELAQRIHVKEREKYTEAE